VGGKTIVKYKLKKVIKNSYLKKGTHLGEKSGNFFESLLLLKRMKQERDP